MSDSERALRRLLDSHLIGVVSTTASGGIKDANEAFLGLIGYDRADLQRLTLDDLTPADQRKTDAAALAQVREFGSVRPWEKAFLRKDGRRLSVLVGVDFEPPDSCAWLVLDVTERRQLEEQLRRSQRMEAVGSFAGGIAHDFNNMLCVITGYLDLLLHGMGEGGLHAHQAMEALRAADKAAALVRQLMVFSRKRAAQPTAIRVDTIVQGMQPLLRRLIGERVELVVRMEPGLAPIWADASQIEQVLMNLAVNARDAMPQGGVLTIELGDGGRVERRLLPRSPPGQPRPYVRLSVSDTGCGMDRETLARAFDPFFTTKGPDHGTGLGLATVHGIVGQCGGMIQVDSEVGRGTEFRILFPAADVAQVQEVEPAAAAAAHLRGSETVLIVEDDELLLDVLGVTLEQHGYSVVAATDADEAVTACAERKGAIDIVLTDVVLPRMSGTELYRLLHTSYPHLKAVYMSGHVDEAFVADASLSGAAFLAKPFGPAVLLEQIRSVVDGPRA